MDRARTGSPFSIAQLWRFAVSRGLRVMQSDTLGAWDLLVHPIDFIRCAEYQTVFAQTPISHDSRICDVSSPKLPSLFLAAGHRVVAGDMLAAEVLTWRRRVRGLSARPELLVFDGRRLPFPNDTFDLTYAVSVLEHIEGDGDLQTVDEMVRVTAPGGYIALNVPFDIHGRENFVERDVYGKRYQREPLFFSRTYDPTTLQARLRHPSVDWGAPVYIYERPHITRIILNMPRPLRWGFTTFAPLWARLMYGITGSLDLAQRPGSTLCEVTLIGRKASCVNSAERCATTIGQPGGADD